MNLGEVFIDDKKEFINKLYFDYNYITGLDEVGRGCIAGETTVASVTFSKDCLYIPGITDSKKLSEKKREQLYDKIINNCVEYKIYSRDAEFIDEFGINHAISECMYRCVENLTKTPNLIIVDHVDNFKVDGIRIISEAKADLNYYCVGAASIVAKVFRDTYMKQLGESYPEYLFGNHKGYGTAKHIEKINIYGMIDGIHRKSFKVKGVNTND